jgi:hypothetical protein
MVEIRSVPSQKSVSYPVIVRYCEYFRGMRLYVFPVEGISVIITNSYFLANLQLWRSFPYDLVICGRCVVNRFRCILYDSVPGIVDIVSNVLYHCDPFE